MNKQFISSTRFLLLLVVVMGFSVASLCAREKTTFVIVHGAWGGSWSFKQTDYILSDAGYIVYRPSLTGLGERHHLSNTEIGLTTHITDVVNTILFDDLHDVILIGHSYGGMVITGVADSIPERIKQLVYLDAFVPNDGESVIDLRASGGLESNVRSGFIIPTWVQNTDIIPRDVPQSLKTFTEPVSYKNKSAMLLPATYILTVDEGKKAEEDSFYDSAERAKERGWDIIEMTADHNPQMTMPNKLAEVLIDIVKKGHE